MTIGMTIPDCHTRLFTQSFFCFVFVILIISLSLISSSRLSLSLSFSHVLSLSLSRLSLPLSQLFSLYTIETPATSKLEFDTQLLISVRYIYIQYCIYIEPLPKFSKIKPLVFFSNFELCSQFKSPKFDFQGFNLIVCCDFAKINLLQ